MLLADLDYKTFYDLLEPKIREITLANTVDDKLHMELTSILLIIMYPIEPHRLYVYVSC